MSLLRVAGLLTALAWMLAAPMAFPTQAQTLRPGGRVTTGGIEVLAPATWSGEGDQRPDHTTVQVQRVARAALEWPLEQGTRLATPIYRVGASTTVFSGWKKVFTVRVPRNPDLPAARLRPALLTWLQVDAAPPHPGGSVPVWVTPETWRVTRDAVEIGVYHLLSEGLVLTVVLLDAH